MIKLEKDEEFKKLIYEENGIVLVDFFATWCMPCKMLTPTLEELSKTLDGKVSVVKVDIDKFPDIAKKQGVMAVPTLILFNDGVAIEKMVGLKSKEDMLKTINPYIK